ncbi:phage protein [Methylobacterium ajmalii]|uniref:phage protein n=1 Tax=Methylobacterium ajmalii TaxID=2738439 RepID=UPI002F2C907A
MSEQYLRAAKVSFGGNGKKLEASELRIRFDTHQDTTSSPWMINLYIYNLKKETIQSIREEYKEITLEAGYESDCGPLFRGQILQVRTFRENITDVATHVIATSAEKARNFAVANKSLSAGHTHNDRVQMAVEAMKEFGVKPGQIDKLSERKFARGFSYLGDAKSLLREVCFATGARWWIQDDRIHVVKNGNALKGETYVLNSTTGLIGLAEQTLDGVVARCLMNRKLYPGVKVQINEASITRAAVSPAYLAEVNNQNLSNNGILGIAADGIYRCELVEHNGDTRGPNWYTEIICVKNDGGYSPSLLAQGIGSNVDDDQQSLKAATAAQNDPSYGTPNYGNTDPSVKGPR